MGEQEFVYNKGSQGLVRNIALLLNIPESRIKVVGLGRMKDGEIWGKHNGVDKYKPPSLLQEGERPDMMEILIDPVELENEDEVDIAEHELVGVYKEAKVTCQKGSINCTKAPVIDSIAVPGWKCHADKYGSGNGCDCDCGVWDPDCDEGAGWSYGVVKDGGEMDLLDTPRVEALLKRFDTKPIDHRLSFSEMLKVRQTLT